MQLFSEWITQIILFLLLGTIFELLLPNNKMKKYINLILGLLLLLILSKPVLYIFQFDVSRIMDPIEQAITEDGEMYTETENEMKKQKNEIETTQDAYIWNEIAAQLKQEANDQLPSKYGQEVTELTLEHNDDNEITAVHGTLVIAGEEGEDGKKEIEPVEIETDTPLDEQDHEVKDRKLLKYLEDIWDIDSELIYLKQEGGAS